MEKKTGYRDLVTQKDYLKVIGANVVNRFGDSWTLCIFLAGICHHGLFLVPFNALGVPMTVEQEYMAPLRRVFNSLGCAAMPLSSALCSMLAVFCPVSMIFVACGAFCVLLFIYAAVRKMQFEAPKEVMEHEYNCI